LHKTFKNDVQRWLCFLRCSSANDIVDEETDHNHETCDVPQQAEIK